MATTKTSICNKSQLLLGKDLLTNVDVDGTPSALKYLAIYEQCLKEVLDEHDWSFATREATLVRAVVPVPEMTEYAYYYELPTDFVHLVQNNDDITNSMYRPRYRIEANYLLSSEDTVTIKYVGLINYPSIYPSTFTELLSLKLAYTLAFSMVSSASVRDELKQLYEVQLPKSIGRDQRMDKTRVEDDYFYERARLMTYSSYDYDLDRLY